MVSCLVHVKFGVFLALFLQHCFDGSGGQNIWRILLVFYKKSHIRHWDYLHDKNEDQPMRSIIPEKSVQSSGSPSSSIISVSLKVRCGP